MHGVAVVEADTVGRIGEIWFWRGVVDGCCFPHLCVFDCKKQLFFWKSVQSSLRESSWPAHVRYPCLARAIRSYQIGRGITNIFCWELVKRRFGRTSI